MQAQTRHRKDTCFTVQGLCTEPSGICLVLSTFKVSGLKEFKASSGSQPTQGCPRSHFPMRDFALLHVMLTFEGTSAAIQFLFHALYLLHTMASE